MQCRNHPTENGVNTCNQCGSWLCDKCSFERGGRIFCPNCATQQATGSDGTSGTVPTGAYRPSPGYPSRTVSWGLLFLFSVVIPLPGLNYMYMGLIKRGLVAMSAFFGVIYLVIQFAGSGTWPIGIIFIFAIPVLILACLFDGFRIRSRINAGEVVTDNIDDITAFIRRNRRTLIVLLLLLVAVNAVGAILPGLLRLLPIIIVIWVIHMLFNKPKP